MNLKLFGEQLRTLRRQAGLSQEQLADVLTQLAQAGPSDEFRIVDGTLLSRWENARAHKGRQWKPTRAYVIHLIRLFHDFLDSEAACLWAANAGYQLSQKELRELFPATTLPASTAVEPSSLPSSQPQASLHPTSIPNNIPAALNSFIGRDEEVALLTQYCHSPVPRLITIVGEGGVGKTRLALAFAQSLLGLWQPSPEFVGVFSQVSSIRGQFFPDGIWFVPLAGLELQEATNPATLLATAIAEAVGCALARTDLEPAEQLRQFLSSKAYLLILDNFEHVIGGTSFVLELLQQAPQLRVLVTSRMPLNCQAERVVKLRGLAFANAEQQAQPPIQSTLDLPCVQLFVERSRQQGVDLPLSESTLQVVGRLCQLVNGNPLAIELAAYWVQHYAIEEIVSLLGQHEPPLPGHNLLMTDQQDVPLRHRSMEAVFETSWQLLPPAGQQFLALLSVMRGTFSREAAWAVAGASPHDLADLVNRSLLHVQYGSTGTRGYAMHELLRNFAYAKLKLLDGTLSGAGQVGFMQLAHERHCGYYLNFLAVRMQALHGRAVKATVAEILAVIDNVRAAWHWAVHQKQEELLEQAWPALRTFYHVRSLFLEGEEIFRVAAAQLAESDLADELCVAHSFFLNLLHRYDHAIAGAKSVISRSAQGRSVEAAAHLEWGIALSLQGHHEEALAHLHEASKLARQWQLAAVEARSQRALYRVLVGKGELSKAMLALQQALHHYQQLGYHLHKGFVYRSLGYVAWLQGNYAQALTYYEQCLAVYQEADDQPRVVSIWPHLGEIHDVLHDLGRAYYYYDLAYRHLEESQDRRHAANTIGGFARLMARLGDYDKAHQYGQQALAEQRQLGNEAGVIEALCILGWVYLQQEDAAAASALHQEALAMVRASQVPIHEGIALLGLGKAQAVLGNMSDASVAYQQALAIQRRLGQNQWVLETLSELAHLHMCLEDGAQALALVEEILAQLKSGTLHGNREPLLVVLNCYQVLQTYGDMRAPQLLNEAHQQLQRQAATIEDGALCHSFLHNVRVNRMITALHE